MAHAFEFSDRMRMATKVHKRDKASAVQSFAERRGLARKSVLANNSEVGIVGRRPAATHQCAPFGSNATNY